MLKNNNKPYNIHTDFLFTSCTMNSTDAEGNISLGNYVNDYQTNPFENIAIGYLALAGQESSTNIDNSSRAVRNIAIGIRALNNNSLGQYNIGIGNR